MLWPAPLPDAVAVQSSCGQGLRVIRIALERTA